MTRIHAKRIMIRKTRSSAVINTENMNPIINSKFLLSYGICLGGHKQLLKLTTSSIVYGLRTANLVINSNITLLELVKMSQIIDGIGFYRGFIYFINSILSFRISMYKTFGYYNKHLFFSSNLVILNIFRRFRALLISKKITRKIRKSLYFKQRFFMKSGKSLLQKIFIASRWRHGFVSNACSFFAFADNVLHEKIKLGKILTGYEEKIKSFFDFYPFLPNYGVIGDHRLNYWIVNEFKMARVPNLSIIDPSTTKAFFSMHGLAGNACSIDSSLFFLILIISYYIIGYYKQIIKFLVNIKETSFLTSTMKNLYFKKLLVI